MNRPDERPLAVFHESSQGVGEAPTKDTGETLSAANAKSLDLSRSPRPWVLHPWFLAVFPILSLYSTNIHDTGASELNAPLAIAAVATTVVWLAASLLLRDRVRGGFAAALVVLACYAVNRLEKDINGWLYQLSSSIWVAREYRVGPYFSLGFGALLLALAAYFSIFRLRNVVALTKFLNLFSIVLLMFPVFAIARARGVEPTSKIKPAPPIPLPSLEAQAKSNTLPDIYYIILDGLARADILAEKFHLDVEPLLQRLEQKGFYVARQATSNYAQTPLSLSSSLNGFYLDGVMSPKALDVAVLGNLIRGSAVERALRGRGYKTVFYSTGFDQTEYPAADVYQSPYRHVSGFHLMLMTETPAGRFLFQPITDDSYTMTRNRAFHIFNTLPEIADDPAPTFTLAHMLAPHPPFVFGRDGEDVSPHHVRYYLSDGNAYKSVYGKPGTADGGYADHYSDEVAYLLNRLETTVSEVLKRSKTPPILIIQGDHGSGSHLDLFDKDNTDLSERMSIFNAYYLPPSADHAALYPTITPVNSFRMIFNACFKAGLPLLPDRSYFSGWDLPYRFFDVTEEIARKGQSQAASTSNAPSLETH